MSNTQLWNKVIIEIEKKISPQHFKTWILPIICKSSEKEIITLSVNNKFIKDWIHKNFNDLIIETIKEITGLNYSIIIEIGNTTKHEK